ncbi:MAG: phospho-N-acetylmuramoyl-pentapeptide-transferase [Candidatus Dormibacteraceae bacterium]
MILDAITLALSFLIALALYPRLIPLLRRVQLGQVIQAELSPVHQSKAGTPTAGGILFVALAVLAGILAHRAGHPGTAAVTVALALFGLLGLADDVAKRRRGASGLRARYKFPLQVLLALPVVALAQGSQHLIPSPADGLIWPLGVVAVVGAANAVNLTDGVDGLAGLSGLLAVLGTTLLLGGAVAGEKAVAMTLAGALIAFLVWNRHPARVFMGDAGSLGLGAALAALAIQQHWLVLLPLVGLVFVIETLSVMIQVSYFKLTGGRRVFRMTPIHLTLQLEGWSENRIALVFGGVTAISVFLSAWLGGLLA